MEAILEGMTLGGFRLNRLLHDGSDGRKVYLADDGVGEGPQAVVKVHPLREPAANTRLNREFTVLRKVACDAVVSPSGYGVSLPHQLEYLVLPYHGPSLAAVLAAQGQCALPIEPALAMAYAAAVSIGQLHRLGWCHGDLKPGNLLCRQPGKLLLTDFEFACRLPENASEPELQTDLPYEWVGTPPFMAPELWNHPEAKPAASDVWALGVTLYLALVGEYPFGHGDPDSIRQAISRGLPPKLLEFADPVRELFRSLLASDPLQRFADGRQAAAAIAETAGKLGLYLAAGSQAFTELVAAASVGPQSSDGITSTIRSFERQPTDSPSALAYHPQTDVLPEAERPSPTPAAPASAPDRSGGFVGATKSSARSGPEPSFFDITSHASPPIASPVPLNPATAVASQPGPAPRNPITTIAPQSAPAGSPKPAASPTLAGANKGKALSRRAAARWYRRMNPERNFPLSVVLSGKHIRIVGGSGLGITLGTRELVLDPVDPVVSIEPWFPGCLVSPPQANVHCSQDTTIARFWITPLVCEDLPEACVTIRYRGQVVETLATPSTVVTRKTARLLAMLGLVSPVATKALHIAGWNPDDLLRRSVPLAADVVTRLGMVASGLIVACVFLSAALIGYYITRPLLSQEAEPSLLAETA